MRVLPINHPNRPQLFWSQKRGERYAVAMLQKPQIRQIAWQLGLPRPQLYYVSMPYFVHVIGIGPDTLSGVFIYYCNTPPDRLEDQLCHTNLPNTWTNDRVCLGGEIVRNELKRQLAPLGVPREQAFYIVNFFWNGIFNDDIPSHFFDLGRIDPRYQTIDDWAALSRRDPDAVLSTNWLYSCTLEEALERCWQFLGTQV